MSPSLSTLATIPLGLLIARQLFAALGAFRPAVPATDPSRNLDGVLTGVKAADGFLKVVVPFFRKAVADSTARAWLSSLSQVMTPWFFIAGVQGLKEGGSALHLLYPVMAVGMQIAGVGLVTPLIWVPALLASPPSLASLPATPKTTLALALLTVGQLGNLFVASQITKKDPKGSKFIAWFQISPALAWLAWSFVPYIPDSSPVLASIPAAHPEATKYLLLSLTPLTLLTHVATVTSLLRSSARRAEFFSIFTAPESRSVPGKIAANFLAWDFVGLLAAVAYYVAYVGGEFDQDRLVTFATRALVVGPGTATTWTFSEVL
ncbi:hypothetical protein M427DRAFT_57385 [Gonapodya prolifera JEL478]|uniref:Uncharacterized protein n=1 Tax=Gonapodya prolifera (strain JEL478) TaxID=1344416 RepID=A0A139AD41_GONPJ|nr:hypothetical protein M427DRAFT_57385 [Gonapodya prolifera JEL478]|eukprot:KXS14732.1 hypothetical protein M427DRAFT_57385 [Gonapodya prolifera JEL478]